MTGTERVKEFRNMLRRCALLRQEPPQDVLDRFADDLDELERLISITTPRLIAEAPRDWVLVWCPSSFGGGEGSWIKSFRLGDQWRDEGCDQIFPTYFLPLPQPVETKNKLEKPHTEK